ncbi:MAG TPA: hypothetical protein VLF71_02655 [Candidatus Saccharimonadales bacterium]|nr:hypothetical protein [Candidatus Saccharimonadales bacterium]
MPGQGVECAVGRFVDYGDSPEAVDLCAKNMVTGGDGVAYFSGNCLIASSKCVLPSRFVDELPE